MLNSKMYITIPELMAFSANTKGEPSIAEDTIKKGLYRGRNTASHSWRNIKQGGLVYIDFESIPAKTKSKLKTPEGLPLTKQYLIDRYTEKQREDNITSIWMMLEQYLLPVSQQDLQNLHNYRIQERHIDIFTGEEYYEDKGGLTDSQILEYANMLRWLSMMSDKRWKSKAFRIKLNPNFRTYKDFLASCIEVMKLEKIKLPHSYDRLIRKISEYNKIGAIAVISKKLGKRNNLKIDDEQLKYLIMLASDGRKIDFEKITLSYNEEGEKKGWPEITSRAVKQRLNRPEVKPIWYRKRHGYKEWESKFNYTILTERASCREALWVADGTKVNRFYKVNGGKTPYAKLYYYVIIDAYSDYILGWKFYIGNNESKEHVSEAMKKAVHRSGNNIPYQALYDGSSGNKQFFSDVNTKHFPAMPYNGQSKSIERMFGQLQQHVIRRSYNSTGQNIQAKSLDSKINMDLIHELHKHKELPNLDEAIREAELDIHIWNNQPKKRDGLSPRERYEQSNNPKSRKANEFDQIDMFWKWREGLNTYNKTGITIERKSGSRDYYEVLNNEGDPCLDFHMDNVTRKFRVKESSDLLEKSKIALYDESGRFITFAHEKKKMPRALQDFKEGDRAEINKRLKLKKELDARVIQTQEEIAESLGVTNDYDTIQQLGFSFIPKDVQDKAEQQMFEEDYNAVPTHNKNKTEFAKNLIKDQKSRERKRIEEETIAWEKLKKQNK